jgi:hypothetical protein
MASVAAAIFLCSVVTGMYFTTHPCSNRTFSPFVKNNMITPSAVNDPAAGPTTLMHTAVMMAENHLEAQRAAAYLVDNHDHPSRGRQFTTF